MKNAIVSLGLVLAVALLAGCAPLAVRTSGRFAPDRLAEMSRTTENPFTNYENVWAATMTVMQKNFLLGPIDKNRGTIKSHPTRRYSTFMTLKMQAFATITYEDGLFIPEIKMVTFMDTSEAEAFSSGPSRRNWHQMIQSQERAMQLEEDVRRLLVPEQFPPDRSRSPEKSRPATPSKKHKTKASKA